MVFKGNEQQHRLSARPRLVDIYISVVMPALASLHILSQCNLLLTERLCFRTHLTVHHLLEDAGMDGTDLPPIANPFLFGNGLLAAHLSTVQSPGHPRAKCHSDTTRCPDGGKLEVILGK